MTHVIVSHCSCTESRLLGFQNCMSKRKGQVFVSSPVRGVPQTFVDRSRETCSLLGRLPKCPTWAKGLQFAMRMASRACEDEIAFLSLWTRAWGTTKLLKPSDVLRWKCPHARMFAPGDLRPAAGYWDLRSRIHRKTCFFKRGIETKSRGSCQNYC